MTEVELLQANPQYAYIKYPNDRESTVSLRDLAPTEKNDSNDIEIMTYHRKSNGTTYNCRSTSK